MLEKYDKYSFKVSKEKPFFFPRFLDDWNKDGGWWRILESGNNVSLMLSRSTIDRIPLFCNYFDFIAHLEEHTGGPRGFARSRNHYVINNISLSCAMSFIDGIKEDLKEMKEKQTTINVYGDFDKPEPITPKFKVGDKILRNINGNLIPFTIVCIAIDKSVNVAAYGLAFINLLGKPTVGYYDIKDIDSSSALIVDYIKLETKEQEAESEPEPTE